MPQAINLSLTNHAAVAKTFALASPASATSPAVWLLREGANQSVFPKVEQSSRKNGSGDARKVQLTVTVPVGTVDAAGATRRAAAMQFNVDCTIPDLVPDAIRNDAIAFAASAMANALLKECFFTGYAAT